MLYGDDDVRRLADALCVNDPLPNLTCLTYNGSFSNHALFHLTSYLSCEGAFPSLKKLAIEDNNIDIWSCERVELVANMIKARAADNTCMALEKLDGKWFHGGTVEDRTRMLRVLLPSPTKLDMLWENQIAANCFGSNLMLTQLQVLDITLFRNAVIPSVEIWEALPALQSLRCRAQNDIPRAELAEALARTLHRGVGFQRLQRLKVARLNLSDAAAIDLMSALVDTDAG